MFYQNATSTVWLERPAGAAAEAGNAEEEAHAMEDFVYHRPVLQREVLRLLNPKPGSLIVDGTCGGGGHTEALLETGADVLALDQDPDAVQHVSKRLARLGRRIIVRQANFRHTACVLDELGIRTIGGALLDLGFFTPTRECGTRFQLRAKRSPRHAHGSTNAADRCYYRR